MFHISYYVIFNEKFEEKFKFILWLAHFLKPKRTKSTFPKLGT